MTLTDDELAGKAMEIDPDRSNVILCVGTKGSGKSEAARQIFNAWPYDRVVIDVTGDARPDDPTTIAHTAPFPSQMPAPTDPDAVRSTIWARVDPRSDTYMEDQDKALGLGLYPRHNNTLVWVDEYGQLATANKVLPNTRLALQSSRHYYLTLLLSCPRPVDIPVLTMQQADKIFIFNLPNRDDRDTIAKNMGFPAAAFEAAHEVTMRRDPHAFLLFDRGTRRLFDCPPLPGVTARGPRS